MEHLERPEEWIWDERRLWFEGLEAACSRAGAPAPSEQACALMIDLQAVFCAGAWTAAIVLAAAIVDSQASEALGRGLRVPGLESEEVRWLRDLRNRLVHEDRKNPVITVDDQWLERAKWERYARRAVETALAVLYPGSPVGRAVAPGGVPGARW